MIYDEVFQDEKYCLLDERKVKLVADWLHRNRLQDVLDVGAGRGHYIKHLKGNITALEPSTYAVEHDLVGLNVIPLDILSFTPRKPFKGLYCMDVLEHLPPEELDANLKKLTTFAPKALFGIANHSDKWNRIELHLIQEDAKWWEAKLKQYYKHVNKLVEDERYYLFETS